MWKAGDWHKLRELTPTERRELFEAVRRVIAASLVLRWRQARSLPRDTRASAAGDRSDHFERARGLARLVEIAAARSPLRARCLERSLALSKMLRARGIDHELHVGVRKEGAALEAHAWVECGGHSLDPSHSGGAGFEPIL